MTTNSKRDANPEIARAFRTNARELPVPIALGIAAASKAASSSIRPGMVASRAGSISSKIEVISCARVAVESSSPKWSIINCSAKELGCPII